MEQPNDEAARARYEEVSRGIAEHQRMTRLLWERMAALDETHAGKWVGLGPEEVLLVADTLDEIVELVDPDHDPKRIAVIDYIWPEPHIEILAAV